MHKILIFGILFCFLPLAWAATITGVIYDDQFEPLRKAVVYINTEPEQQLVSQYGAYIFTVEPNATYIIRATFTQNGITKEFAREEIIVSRPGTYTVDLIPKEGFIFAVEFEDTIRNRLMYRFETHFWQFISVAFIIIIILLASLFFTIRFFLKRITVIRSEKQEQFTLNDDDVIKKKIISILEKANNSVSQKEIRKHFALSEAKISLVLSEMERDNSIRKNKIGRKNVIELQTLDSQQPNP